MITKKTASGLALLLVAAQLVACAEVPYPTAQTVAAARAELPPLQDAVTARAYVRAARDGMLEQRHNLQRAEGSLDVGIGGGAIAAMLGGALHWASTAVIAASAATGVSYATAQSVQPKTQIQIIDSGLAALDCVDSKAESAYPLGEQIARILQPVVSARDTLLAEWTRQKTADGQAISPADLVQLQAAIANADGFIAANQPGAYQQVRLAVDAIVTTTNTQLNNTIADPTAVQKAFAAVSVTASGAAGGAKAPTVAPPPGAFPIPGTSHATVVAQLVELQNIINAAHASIAALPPITTALDFRSCVPGAIMLVLSPAAPVALDAGQSYTVNVSGGPANWGWDGKNPPDIHIAWGNNSASYVLTVSDPITAPGTYRLDFTPPQTPNGSAGGSVQTLSVTIPKPAGAP